MSYVPTLKKLYAEQVVPELVKTRGYKNKHQVPKLVKINLNTGIDAEADKNQIADIARDIGADRRPEARSSTAQGHRQFQAEAQPGRRLPRHARAATPCGSSSTASSRWRSRPSATFRGVSSKLDGQGNYNIGITDFTIFPEITVENVKKTMGLDITIVTTAETDDEGRELLQSARHALPPHRAASRHRGQDRAFNKLTITRRRLI